MDILSARKKAAERAKAKKKSEPEPAPAAQFATPEKLPRTEEPAPPPVPVTAATPAEKAAPVVGEMAAPASPSGLQTGEAVAAPEIEMLSFRLGTEEYAVMIDEVKEVLKDRDLTPVPNAPDFILGVMALRGPVLPVIDLCRRLGLPSGRRDDRSRIVVVSLNDEEAGLMVDRVTGVVRISSEAVRPAPETIEHGAEFLKGIARKDDRLFILLDIGKTITA